MKITGLTYPLYELSYGNDFPGEQVFLLKFETLPSSFTNSKNRYGNDVISHLMSELKFERVSEHKTHSRHAEASSLTQHIINYDMKMIIGIKKMKDNRKGDYYVLSFIYEVNDVDIEERITSMGLNKFLLENKRTGISLVKMEMGMLDVEEYELNIPEIDLELNYGSEFVKIHDTLMGRLRKDYDKGIILLHGDPGTGKTSYIKYLTKLITEKEILFIPPSMAEALAEPSIIPFLMEHKNSILIIEDAERIIGDRDLMGSSPGVSNILNLTDGILGDCLNIQIIATFNMKREKIDQALLRKGRLIAEHKFTILSVDETNRLLETLGKEQRVDKGMTLADIYNIDEEVYKTENKTKIGFNS